MPAPNPLWSGDRDPGLRDRENEHRTEPLPGIGAPEPATRSMPTGPAFRPPVDPPEAPLEHARRRGPLAGFVVGAVLATVAFAAGALVSGTDGGPGDVIKEAKPLEATSGGQQATKVGEVYREAGNSVVQVRRGGGSGTGFIVEGPGLVVTNAHVVGNAKTVQLILERGDAPVTATVTGTDESSDLAVLKVNPDALKGRKALPLADSDKVNVGDTAVAIGFPLGLDRTVTAGIVSGIGRQIEAPNGFSIDKVIQTDAPINPGNSGGPLLDDRGRVIGVNSQIATAGSQGNVGIGFAVPANTVRDVVPTLSTGQAIKRSFLGVSTAPPADSSAGAEVAKVTPGGPASQAGLQGPAFAGGTGGDIIVGIDGKRVSSPEDVSAAISGKVPGDRVEVEVRRSGDLKKVGVTLGTRPKNAGP
ncbi:MAG: trypsin-like peptidase domain-containing protein [Solirubrobacterales bacterium]|nr:trypsin-like peptidase domain-containing protein [Solirubrobacterales bacterium]